MCVCMKVCMWVCMCVPMNHIPLMYDWWLKPECLWDKGLGKDTKEKGCLCLVASRISPTIPASRWMCLCPLECGLNLKIGKNNGMSLRWQKDQLTSWMSTLSITFSVEHQLSYREWPCRWTRVTRIPSKLPPGNGWSRPEDLSQTPCKKLILPIRLHNPCQLSDACSPS